jgi:2-oxoglutarate ferredoxin oxidoreductase subunit alpha
MEVLEGYQKDYDKMAEDVAEYEEYKADDADILVIAHGIVARSARTAIDELRARGIKAGLFRPITIRPLAVKPLREAVSRAKQVLFTESANGQLAQMVLEKIYGLTTPYSTLFKMGVGVTGDDIVNKVSEMIK